MVMRNFYLCSLAVSLALPLSAQKETVASVVVDPTVTYQTMEHFSASDHAIYWDLARERGE